MCILLLLVLFRFPCCSTSRERFLSSKEYILVARNFLMQNTPPTQKTGRSHSSLPSSHLPTKTPAGSNQYKVQTDNVPETYSSTSGFSELVSASDSTWLFSLLGQSRGQVLNKSRRKFICDATKMPVAVVALYRLLIRKNGKPPWFLGGSCFCCFEHRVKQISFEQNIMRHTRRPSPQYLLVLV